MQGTKLLGKRDVKTSPSQNVPELGPQKENQVYTKKNQI